MEFEATEGASNFNGQGVARNELLTWSEANVFGIQEKLLQCYMCRLLGCECILENGRISSTDTAEIWGHIKSTIPSSSVTALARAHPHPTLEHAKLFDPLPVLEEIFYNRVRQPRQR